jgi:GTP diphosphokinase / guanosine-3',5'-bis(diphosphate) 3'-diphosphatase
MINEWLAVLRAADTAARWHVQQRRKGAAQEPYINHLLEVARLVAEATAAKDANLVIAAILHDAIEDQEVSRETIAETFGSDVADLVAEVTDDKSLPKEVRKRLQIEKAASKTPRAKLLKLADKTSNLRAIASSPPPDWSAERRLDYVAWARSVAERLYGTNEWLEERFSEAADAAEAVSRQSDALIAEPSTRELLTPARGTVSSEEFQARRKRGAEQILHSLNTLAGTGAGSSLR